MIFQWGFIGNGRFFRIREKVRSRHEISPDVALHLLVVVAASSYLGLSEAWGLSEAGVAQKYLGVLTGLRIPSILDVMVRRCSE